MTAMPAPAPKIAASRARGSGSSRSRYRMSATSSGIGSSASSRPTRAGAGPRWATTTASATIATRQQAASPSRKSTGVRPKRAESSTGLGARRRHSKRVNGTIMAIPDREQTLSAATHARSATVTVPAGRAAALAGRDRRQVAVLVQVELAVLDAEHERVPFGLGEVQLARLRLGGVVHHVKLGLARLVRRAGGVGGDVHLDPALGLLHAHRLLPTARPGHACRDYPRSVPLLRPSLARLTAACSRDRARRTGRSGRRAGPARSGSA